MSRVQALRQVLSNCLSHDVLVSRHRLTTGIPIWDTIRERASAVAKPLGSTILAMSRMPGRMSCVWLKVQTARPVGAIS